MSPPELVVEDNRLGGASGGSKERVTDDVT